ncbi:hypothetical protein [uncultured Propionivibrio sp.]|uniref:hypothetical protein n=1 Tax=uncultured Propionivibrio sp. TaxID=426737 RepID=UPI0029BFD71C|nr:hypothetical protein [uncultured Propionivibrio sp.]
MMTPRENAQRQKKLARGQLSLSPEKAVFDSITKKRSDQPFTSFEIKQLRTKTVLPMHHFGAAIRAKGKSSMNPFAYAFSPAEEHANIGFPQ